MTEIEEGMVVRTDTERLREYRKLLLELLFAEGNHVCAVCVSNGTLRVAGPGRGGRRRPRAGAPTGTRRARWTSPTSASGWTSTAASAARAACAPATRWRARTSGTWPAAARSCTWWPTWASRGATRDTCTELRQVRAGLPHRRALREGRRGGRDDEGSPLPQVHRLRPGAAAMDRAVKQKARLATVWLGRLFRLPHVVPRSRRATARAGRRRWSSCASPLVDTKAADFPEVDVTLVEGAVANEEHLEMLHLVRARSKVLVAFGDCAVTGNVSAMRNVFAGAGGLRPGLPRDLGGGARGALGRRHRAEAAPPGDARCTRW